MARHSGAIYIGGAGGSQSRWAGIHRKRVLSEMAGAGTHNSDSQLNRHLVEVPG